MRNNVRLLLIASLSCALASCGGVVGLGVGAVGRSVGTGDNYSSWKSNMPDIPPQMGRLLVYNTGRKLDFYAVNISVPAARPCLLPTKTFAT